jgi:hypothetical protein
MNMLLKSLLAMLCFAALSTPAVAQRERAYAPENLRTLSYNDQVRVISLEYSDQSNGRRIPDDQLRFYLDQVNRSNWGFSQIKSDIARSLGGGVNPPQPGGNVRCESTDNRARTCQTPWQAPSRLTRQLSQSPCVEGRNWSSQRGQVTVWGGCRAEFAPGNDPHPGPGPGLGDTIRCESVDNRARTCPTNWPGHSRLIRQISGSGCVEGRTWQSQMGQVYVSGGCRAEFGPVRGPAPQPGASETIRCESTNNRPRTCNTPWNGQSRLIRQISGSGCVEGNTWQSRAGVVYVSGGCRGEFAPEYGGGPGGGEQSVTCASVNNRYTTCAWTGRGTPRLLQQLSQQACIRGQSWGLVSRNAIWVNRGCRGRFGN